MKDAVAITRVLFQRPFLGQAGPSSAHVHVHSGDRSILLVRTLALTLAAVLVASGLLLPTTAPATAVEGWAPRGGPTFNSATGPRRKQRAIYRKIMRGIASSPRGSEIDIFTWNFRSRGAKKALLKAQRRGVRVRLLMDDVNSTADAGNASYKQLRRGLRRGNEGRRKSRRSWARVCEGTCRWKGGAAHSKFFLFSSTKKRKRVVMHGSANLTVASTTNQWNDLYTHVGHRGVWGFMDKVFTEAARDRKAKDPYATRSIGRFRLVHFPNVRTKKDPVMQMLRKVKCRGARNTRNGRTQIRIAPDVIRSPRGMRLAKRVRYLHNHGCNVKIGYTVMGIKHGRMLRRAGVPMVHMVRDIDNDGQFDDYFHMKSMTIRGHYGKDRSGWALLNGSANWSGLAKVSDENLGIYRRRNRVRRYAQHINYWYEWFRGRHRTSARASVGTTLDGGRLIFGHDEDAVYADGRPVSTDGTDPFAQLPAD